MKKTICFLILIAIVNTSLCQDKLKVESLKLNSAPAFVILGVEPENIQRPSSPSQFIAGLQNGFVNGKLKPNLAFEITPFFLANSQKNSKRFEPKQYLLSPDRNVFQTIRKSLSISLATSESDTVVFGKLEAGTGLGMGLRFLLVDGKANASLLEWNKQNIIAVYFEELYTLIHNLPPGDVDIKYVLDKATSDFLANAITGQNAGIKETELKKAILKAKDDLLFDLITNKIKQDQKTLDSVFFQKSEAATEQESETLKILNSKKTPFAKEGFMLEVGAGHAGVFEGNRMNDLKSAKGALWLTPSWRWNMSKDGKDISLFDFMGVLRYTFNNKKDSVDVADYFDTGVKGQFTHNKWSGSVEFISRWASEKPDDVKSNWTYRLALGIDYKISEAITFKFTFGSNFDGNTASYSKPKEMFAIGGLNLGIFNPKENK